MYRMPKQWRKEKTIVKRYTAGIGKLLPESICLKCAACKNRKKISYRTKSFVIQVLRRITLSCYTASLFSFFIIWYSFAMAHDALYTREITPPPDKPIKNGKPVFGSFSGAFKKFDIKGLIRPFGNLPAPRIITNTRITGSMRFMFCDEDIIGEIGFFSCFSFSLMETTFWLRKTNQKYSYRQYLHNPRIHNANRIRMN